MGLKIEEAVVFVLVVGGVWHRIVNDTALQRLGQIRFRVAELHLGAYLVVEVNHTNADYAVLDFGDLLTVVVEGVLESEGLLLLFRVE